MQTWKSRTCILKSTLKAVNYKTKSWIIHGQCWDATTEQRKQPAINMTVVLSVPSGFFLAMAAASCQLKVCSQCVWPGLALWQKRKLGRLIQFNTATMKQSPGLKLLHHTQITSASFSNKIISILHSSAPTFRQCVLKQSVVMSQRAQLPLPG